MTSPAIPIDNPQTDWSKQRTIAAIAAVSAGSILASLDANIANVALPVIAKTLGIKASSAVIVVSAYHLVLAMVLLPFAAFGDRYGHGQMFKIGFSLYLFAAAGCYFAGSFEMLIVFRVLQALAAASLLSVSIGLVRAIYPPHLLGRGMGLNTMVASAGSAIAPVLGGFIISQLSWNWVFTAGMPFAVLGLLTTWALPKAELSKAPYDTLGAVMCAATFGFLIFGFQALAENIPLWGSLGCLVIGSVIAAIFIRYECKVNMPVLPVDLLARPLLALSVSSNFLAVLGSTALFLYLPFQLAGHGFSAAMIGAMLSPFALSIMIFAPMAGLLSDRIAPQILGLIGLTLATLSCISFILLPEELDYITVAWRCALCGTGFSLFFSPNGRLMIASAPRARVAGASSLLSTTRMFGQALSSAMLSGILAIQLSPRWAFTVITILVTCALACAIARMFIKAEASA